MRKIIFILNPSLLFLLIALRGQSQITEINVLYQNMFINEQPDSIKAKIANRICEIAYLDTTGEVVIYLDSKGIPKDSIEAAFLSDIYSCIGEMTVYDKQKCDQKLFWNIKARNLLEGFTVSERQAKLSQEIGRLYFLNGMYKESIDEYLVAAKIYKTLKNSEELLAVYVDLATTYELYGYHDKSENYWKIVESANNSEIRCLDKMALYDKKAWQYYEDDQYELAIRYQLELLDMNVKCHYSYSQRYNMARLARFYISAGKYKKAIYVLDSLSILDRKQDSVIQSITWYYYGIVHKYQKKYDLAIEDFTTSVRLAAETHTISQWPYYEGFQYLNELYKVKGNELKAAECLEKKKQAVEIELRNRDLDNLKDLCVQLKYYERNNYSSDKIEDIRKKIERIEEKLSEEK